jgi:hypothetical protein
MNETVLQVKNIIGDSFAVEAEDGQKVFDHIVKSISSKRKVNLSFKNIELVTTAFLNTAVGQLYDKFSEEEVRSYFMVSHTTNSIEISLKRVVKTAKLHYSDPDALQRSIDEIMNE